MGSQELEQPELELRVPELRPGYQQEQPQGL